MTGEEVRQAEPAVMKMLLRGGMNPETVRAALDWGSTQWSRVVGSLMAKGWVEMEIRDWRKPWALVLKLTKRGHEVVKAWKR